MDELALNSPFPGMDPYLEARHLWKGLHTQLIGELSTHQLPPLLAPSYYVDAEPSLQIRAERDMYPDIQIVAQTTPAHTAPAGARLAIAEPTATIVTAWPEEDEEDEESALYIREAQTEQLVTGIEILSYSNKTVGAEKRARYLAKRRELLASGIHLVEVDLLRGGRRVAAALPDQPYHIIVSRADAYPQSQVWSFGFNDEIPAAAVPLFSPDEQVPLPLQIALQTIYQARRFRQRLDYHRDPEGPLTRQDKATIKEIVASSGI